MKKFLGITLLVVLLIATCHGKMVINVVNEGERMITTYIDESKNFTKRVIQDGQSAPTTYATQSISVTTIGAFSASATIKAVRTDNQITLAFKSTLGTVTTASELFLNVDGILDPTFFPQSLSSSSYVAAWPFFISDGGDNVARIHWYGLSSSSAQYAYFKVYGVNGANLGMFTVGSNRGWDKDNSITYYKF